MTRLRYFFLLSSTYFFPLAFLILAVIFAPEHAYVEPDSGGYINYASSRTIGYPALIWLSSAIFGDFNDVVISQLLIFVISISFLIKKAWGLEKGWLVVLGVLLVSFVNPLFMRYHYSILSESPFFSCVALVLAFSISIASYPNNFYSWFGLGLSIGLSILVRPVGYSFLPLMLIISVLTYVLVNTPVWKKMLCSWLVCGAIIGTGVLAERQFHGSDRVSLLPLVIFGKAMLVEASDAPLDSDDNFKKLWDQMENDGKEVRELLLDASRVNIAADRYLRQNYEVYFQYQYGHDLIKELAQDSAVNIDRLKLEVGLSRIESDLVGYLKLTARNFMDLWGVYATSFSPFVDEGNAFINKRRPLPFNELRNAIPDELQARTISWFTFPMISIAFGCSLAILVIGLFFGFVHRDLRKQLILPIITSLMVNGNFLLIGMLGVGVARYSLAMMLPISVMVLSFMIFLMKFYEFYRPNK